MSAYAKQPPVSVYSENAEAAAAADVVVLAVKPQIIAEAANSICAAVSDNNAVVISIAAWRNNSEPASKTWASSRYRSLYAEHTCASALRRQRLVCQ